MGERGSWALTDLRGLVGPAAPPPLPGEAPPRGHTVQLLGPRWQARGWADLLSLRFSGRACLV